MKHLKKEQIASMAEGNITGAEHEECLKHLAECETCFKAYTDTMKFVEEEKKDSAWWRKLRLPGFKEIPGKFTLPELSFPFPKKVLVPAAAMLLIAIFILSLLFIFQPGQKTDRRSMQYAADFIEEIKRGGTYNTFTPANNKHFAAFRTGVLIEILELTIDSGETKLQQTIIELLSKELKAAKGLLSRHFSVDKAAAVHKENFREFENTIRDVMEKKSCLDIFLFGRFIERVTLSTLENKPVNREELTKYRQIIRTYEDIMPRGVLKHFEKLKPGGNSTTGNRAACIAIKDIFFE